MAEALRRLKHAGVGQIPQLIAQEEFATPELRRRYRNLELHDRTNVYNTDLIQALELRSMLDCAEAVMVSAKKMRSESMADCSRGGAKGAWHRFARWFQRNTGTALNVERVPLASLKPGRAPVARNAAV